MYTCTIYSYSYVCKLYINYVLSFMFLRIFLSVSERINKCIDVYSYSYVCNMYINYLKVCLDLNSNMWDFVCRIFDVVVSDVIVKIKWRKWKKNIYILQLSK